MAAKRRSSAKGRFPFLPVVIALVVGVAGGYCWRSYAPLPVPVESPLTATEPAADQSRERALEKELANERVRSREAQVQLQRMRQRVGELEGTQSVIEAEQGDDAIRKLLENGG